MRWFYSYNWEHFIIKCGQCLNSMLSEDGNNVLVAVGIFPKDIVDSCVVCCNVSEHALCPELSWCAIIFCLDGGSDLSNVLQSVLNLRKIKKKNAVKVLDIIIWV